MMYRLSKLLASALIVLTASLPALPHAAHATTISCGDCHGTPPVDGDNCAGDARGLHGTHGNYSSLSYPKTMANYGMCAYCHTATAVTTPTTTHINFYVNVTSTAKAPGLDFDSSTSTCTSACHKNEGATAKWGNYTATTVGGIKLTCNSCHDDSTASVMSLSGAHAAHLGTAITVSGLGAGTNADCTACHADNTNDLWSLGKADDGTKKAYPHASDGTNVVSDNAALNAGLSASRGAGATDTCANACHNNATTDQWGAGTLTCNSCHYYTSGTIMGGAHNSHVVTQGFPCTYCHVVPGAGDTSHVTALPAVSDNAAVIANPGPNAGASWNDSTNTCSNTGAGCHLITDVCWVGCASTCAMCHNYPDGNNWTSGGHAVQYGSPAVNTHLPLATAFNAATDAYDTLMADTTKCGKCHYGLTEASNHKKGTVDVVPATGNNYCGSGSFTVNVNTSGSDVTCSDVSCHSGKTTPNWW